MKLTKEIESEVLPVYNNWLHSYLNGDVETYDFYLDDVYHFIGSTNSEEFLNRTDTTNFFKATADQLSGKTDLRNNKITLEKFGELVFVTQVFDAWFLNGTEWAYYGRFRFSSVLRENKEGWRFIYQHFSTTDSKAEAGETIGFDKVSAENEQLREAVQRRTRELELKNRELEIETALQRIRSQATAMQKSSDLLDVVVTMRSEFIKLGHEAHYFWHMLWLPERYEKAMTSGDGTRIGFVMELPRHIHGDIPLLANWEKGDEPTAVYPMDTEEALAYVHKMVTLGDFQHIDPQAPSEDDIRHIGGLTFIMARTTHGEIGYSLPGVVKDPPPGDLDILVRFAGAFDLAHLRFLDLKKAEAQAREVQIELALEKVRSRTMAMQKSSELKEAAGLLFQQVIALGVPAFSCGYNIWEKDDKECTAWMSNDESGINPAFKIPLTEDPNFIRFYESRQNGEAFYVLEMRGARMQNHYRYLRDTVPIFDDVFTEIEKTGGTLPETQIHHLVNFSHGNVMFITLEPSPESYDIFQRFGRVFEQTYTRFLDLQKAEAQARESDIELALERVRARTMAMQKSHELKEVIQVVYDQLVFLNIHIEHTGFIIDYKANDDMHIWLADRHEVPSEVTIPYFDSPHWNSFIAAKERGLDFFANQLTFDEKNKFYQELFELIPGVPQETSDYYFSCPGLAISTVLFENVGLYIENFSGIPYSESENNTLIRFGKVFQQTYTRFLDLQKAEAQMRESEIELGLERVRARTMAMQNSDELQDAAIILFQQLKNLGIVTGSCGFNIWDKEEKKAKVWMTSPEGGFQAPFNLPHTESSIYKATYTSMSAGEDFFVTEVAGEALKKHFDYLSTLPGIGDVIRKLRANNYVFPERLIYHFAFFNCGYLSFHTHEEVLEAHDIFKRFAKVFEQTYTRFLDLKKAEAQAREAQIEAALERVRGRSMAMHKSEELADLSLELVGQVQKLGISTWFCAFNIYDDDEKGSLEWGSNGQGVFPKYRTPREGIFLEYYEVGQSGEILLIREIDEKACPAHYEYLCSLPGVGEQLLKMKATGISFPTSQIDHVAFFKYGYIIFITFDPAPEAHNIFKRFAKVFEQTYTRFLDLKKAEAQAREAQIEAALERVRSRTMAMHNSGALVDVVNVTYTQLLGLDIPIDMCVILVNIRHSTDLNMWIASPEQTYDRELKVAYFRHTFFDQLLDGFKRKQSHFDIKVDGNESKEWFKHVFANTMVGKHVNESRKKRLLSAQGLYGISTNEYHHGLMVLNFEKYEYSSSEVEVFLRFSKVFEQAYVRFLDLQKAESQAREAQIEAAVERVRAEAMAMHSTSDFEKVARQLLEQVQQLDLEGFTGAQIILIDEKEFLTTCDFSSPGNISDPKSQTIYYDAHKFPIMGIEVLNKWKEGEAYFVMDFDLEKLKRAVREWEDINVNIASALNDAISGGHLTHQWDACGRISNGMIAFDMVKPPDDDVRNITIKMTHAFEQAYTRFLDLQKAEAQAREAQIEAALERTRTQSMLMQHSDELDRTIQVFHEQLHLLGIASEFSYLWLPDEEKSTHLFWATWFETKIKKGGTIEVLPSLKTKSVVYPLDKTEPAIAACYLAWESGETLHVNPVPAEGVKEYFASWPELLQGAEHFKVEFFPKGIFYVDAYMKYGCFGIMIRELLSEEEKNILSRFTKEFERAYTRFLDLQKAEAQAREAEIEAALEKVRSRSLAVNRSDEFNEVVGVVFEKLNGLNMPVDSVTIALTIDGTKDWDIYGCGKGESGLSIIKFTLPYFPNAFSDDILAAQSSAKWGYFSKVYSEAQKNEYYEFAFKNTELKNLPDDLKQRVWKSKSYALSVAYTKNSSIMVNEFNGNVLGEDQTDILKRFSRVFEQAYIRFLDLKKAEAQAREAQIEAALEKVRSRAMAMYKSEELFNVGELLYQELSKLGIEKLTSMFVLVDDERKIATSYGVNPKTGEIRSIPVVYKLTEIKTLKSIYASWEKGEPFLIQQLNPQQTIRHQTYMAEKAINFPFAKEQLLKLTPKRLIINTFNFEYGYLLLVGGILLKTEQQELLTRFAKVFEQAYTRFLDLQKAEAQARESQINLAVEKVRAKALAMHKSEEIMEVVSKLKDEVMDLDIPDVIAATIFLKEGDDKVRMWDLSSVEKVNNGYQLPFDITFKLKESDPYLYVKRVWENPENYFLEKQEEKDFKRYVQWLRENNKVDAGNKIEAYIEATNMTRLYHVVKKMNSGKIAIDLLDPPSDEIESILTKMGAAFDLAYKRFEDLQKAEAQVREAQIEAALEKVRSRSLSMSHPDELHEVVAVVAQKLQELGVIVDAGGVIICTYFPDSKDVIHWIAGTDFSNSGKYLLPYFDELTFNDAWNSKNNGDTFFSKWYSKSEKNLFFKYAFEHSDYKNFPEDFKEFALQSEQIVVSFAWAENSALMLPSHAGIVPSEDETAILIRFAKVFEQAYIRFMDLQKAEVRARETEIEFALERVRSQTMAMQHPNELEEVVTLVVEKLTDLGVVLDANGVIICTYFNESKDVVHWMASPDFTFSGRYLLPYFDHPIFNDAWNSRENGDEYFSKNFTVEEKNSFFEYAFKHSDYKNFPDEFKEWIFQNDKHSLSFAWSKNSAILIPSHTGVVPNELQIEILKRFAKVFEQAYIRFLDLQVKEEQAAMLFKEKQRLEKTLDHLQNTQKQLIQSEKMASLGELTAGIAHEIQNPLNFVNNFSELSNELLVEMNEELAKGDLEEARAIASDIKQNLEKIYHHGKRADNIVKSMIQHSRNSTATKELTDINKLTDEFFRLAYHGLRAKDKSFNAKLITDYDDKVGSLPIIAQDMGRVILNLITNAFYTVNEKKIQQAKGFNPTVTVTTKKTDDQILIAVIDNGNGIPQPVLEKIFQPFFTTKPAGQGTGLGLSLAFDIVTKGHGGELKVETTAGEGSSFIISIPSQ